MNEIIVNNPFVVGKYIGEHFFCDRKEEMIFLKKQMENGRNVAHNVTSSQFIKKYNLSSASSVQAAIKNLLKNDIVTQEENTYRIYDFFFSEWLATVY